MAKRTPAVTLESLGRKIDASVEQSDRKFEQVDRRYKQLDRKIDTTAARLDAKVDGAVEQLETRIDESSAETRTLFEATRDEVRRVAKGVGALTEKVDTMNDRMDRFEVRTQTNGRDIDILKVAYGDLDRRVTRLEDAPGR